MSLADKIVERNSRPNPNETQADEFGIVPPVPCNADYLVARALILDWQSLPDGASRIHGLHLREDTIFRGHTPIAENRRNMLELTRLTRRVADWEEVAFWRVLKQRLPKLNRKILEITSNLYWDIEQAELIDRDTAVKRSMID